MDEPRRGRRRMRRRDPQIEIAYGSVDGIAQALDHGILERAGELALQKHLRQVAPFGRLLELLRSRLDRLRRLLLREGRGLPRNGNQCRKRGAGQGNGGEGRHGSIRSKHAQLLAQSEFVRHTRPSDMFIAAADGMAAVDHGRDDKIQPVRNADADAGLAAR